MRRGAVTARQRSESSAVNLCGASLLSALALVPGALTIRAALAFKTVCWRKNLYALACLPHTAPATYVFREGAENVNERRDVSMPSCPGI